MIIYGVRVSAARPVPPLRTRTDRRSGGCGVIRARPFARRPRPPGCGPGWRESIESQRSRVSRGCRVCPIRVSREVACVAFMSCRLDRATRRDHMSRAWHEGWACLPYTEVSPTLPGHARAARRVGVRHGLSSRRLRLGLLQVNDQTCRGGGGRRRAARCRSGGPGRRWQGRAGHLALRATARGGRCTPKDASPVDARRSPACTGSRVPPVQLGPGIERRACGRGDRLDLARTVAAPRGRPRCARFGPRSSGLGSGGTTRSRRGSPRIGIPGQPYPALCSRAPEDGGPGVGGPRG
jgi:hypothetical protein